MLEWAFIHIEIAWSHHVARRPFGRKITRFWVDFTLYTVWRWLITGSMWDLKIKKNDLLCILRMPGLIKLSYKHSKSSFWGLNRWTGENHERWIFSKIRKKSSLDFGYVEYWHILLLSPKNFGCQTTGTSPFGPWREGPQNDVFAHFGGKKIRNSKIYFSSNQPFFRANWWY